MNPVDFDVSFNPQAEGKTNLAALPAIRPHRIK
jgi:hypothetical protein